MLKKIIHRLFIFVDSIGAYDRYVPMGFPKYRFLTNRSFIQKLRIKMWTRIAKDYQPFKPFYSKEARETVFKIEKNTHVLDYYKNGTAVIENALSKNSVEAINNIVRSFDLSRDTESNYYQCDLKKVAPDVCRDIIHTLQPFYKTLFPHIDIDERFDRFGTVQLRVDFSVSGKDFGIATANWHPDRFVPTLNAIWFPSGADWGEFEKDVGDPIINDDDIESYINYRDLNSGDGELRDFAYANLGRKKKKFTVEPNSLVVGTHHIQHRRSPFDKPGMRVGVFIDHYNIFSRYDLL